MFVDFAAKLGIFSYLGIHFSSFCAEALLKIEK